MNITVLCGSPRDESNSMAYSKAFKEGAEIAGHSVEIVDVGHMNISGCVACECCHRNGDNVCVINDDMSKVWEALEGAEMVVLASPVYNCSFSGQLQCLLTRLHSQGRPAADKYAMILSSYAPGVFDAMIIQLDLILKYWGAENVGTLTYYGEETQPYDNLEDVRYFGMNIK